MRAAVMEEDEEEEVGGASTRDAAGPDRRCSACWGLSPSGGR